MKIKTLLTVSLLFFGLTAPVVAQEEINTTKAMTDALVSAYMSVDGKEIRIEGFVGTYIGDQIYFADARGRYSLELDAGREVRRQIEGCEIDYIDIQKSPCKIVGMAEIKIDKEDRNIADGIEMELILYEVESFKNIKK